MDLKRKNDNEQDNEQNKKKIKIDFLNYDIVKEIESFNDFEELIKEKHKVYTNLVYHKFNNKIPDTDKEIENTKKEIITIRNNISKNAKIIRKILKSLEDNNRKLKKANENLCDHDKYSVPYYHNERDYYCRKCTWTR